MSDTYLKNRLGIHIHKMITPLLHRIKIRELKFQRKNRKWNFYNLHSMERFRYDPKN